MENNKEMVREEVINLIESRIKSEYGKHGNLDWAGIAARKIYSSIEGMLDVSSGIWNTKVQITTKDK